MEPQREYRPEEKPVVNTTVQQRTAMTAVWIAVAVLAILGLYLAIPKTPEDAPVSGAASEAPATSTETKPGSTGTTSTQDAEKPAANEGSPAKPDEKTR